MQTSSDSADLQALTAEGGGQALNAWNAISVSTRAWVPGSYNP